jgi:RNA polymerase sigma-70 factor (ECF subfamily)
MVPDDSNTNELLEQARRGDHAAREELLGRHRGQLLRMIAVRMDRRLAARVDPSDIVQEALTEASRQLPDYLRQCPLPFYPWLRRLAWEQLVAMTRRHIGAQRRSMTREQPWEITLPDESAIALAGQLVSSGTSPSAHLKREELRDRVQAALAALDPQDREILVLRYLEQLSTRQTADVVGISEGGVKSRLMRALVRLRGLLDPEL